MAGGPGMVARVDGWLSLPDGRLVVLQHGAGLLTGLVGAVVPEASWRCLLLGAPLVQSGQRQRELYLPERCLTTLSSMNADQVRELERQQAEAEADALVAEIGRALGDCTEIDEEQLVRAGQQALVMHSLEVVATATALREAGFREPAPGNELLWLELDVGESGFRMHATQSRAGAWMLDRATLSPEVALCSGIQLPSEAPRGQVMAAVLRAWRGAFPSAPTPARLAPGLLYERHRALLEPALRLRVDR